MSSLSVSWQRILTYDLLPISCSITLECGPSRTRPNSPMLILSLKFALRLVSPSPNSQLNCSQSQSYVTTDGQSASLSWCQAPIWGLRPDFYYCQTVVGLLTWDALSDERTGLPFTIADGSRQRILSWVRVPRDSWPYFTVSDSGLPQPGGTGPRIYIPPE
jgi:hypothetical protein